MASKVFHFRWIDEKVVSEMSQSDAVRRKSPSRTARLRERLNSIKPEDQDMAELIGVLKGLIDIIDDDKRGTHDHR